jgi:hypothetical protein
MKRRIAQGVVLLLAVAGCTEDPLAALRGGAARLVLSSKVLSVNVADSIAVTATAVDEQGNPLPDQPAATSASPAVVSVITATGAPLPQARFFVKGLAFGNGTVNVTVGGVTDSIRVHAYPASVTITGTPDSLNSGSSVDLTATPRDALNAAVAGVTPIDWTVDDDLVADPATPGAVSTVAGKTPGVATITVTLPGGATSSTPLRVVPAPYPGTLSAPSGNPTDIITLTSAGSPFDDDTEVSVGGAPAFTAGAPTPTTLSFAVPPQSSTGAKELAIVGLGDDQLGQRTTFTVNSTSLDDSYEATNNDPATAPVINADGDYFIIVHGDCVDVGNGIGEPDSPGADCDDFFTLTNPSASTATVSIVLDWFEGSADPDLYVTDETVSTLVAGSFFAHPEEVEFDMAPAEILKIWVNLYDNGGNPHVMLRVRVSGL